jgi:hypothetical protein
MSGQVRCWLLIYMVWSGAMQRSCGCHCFDREWVHILLQYAHYILTVWPSTPTPLQHHHAPFIWCAADLDGLLTIQIWMAVDHEGCYVAIHVTSVVRRL